MIKIHWCGRFGNNLFQYCMARIISENLEFNVEFPNINKQNFGNLTNYLKYLPNLRKVSNYDDEDCLNKSLEILGGHKIYLNKVLNNKEIRSILLNGYYQRYEYYKNYKDMIKNDWLKIVKNTKYIVGENDIVIHIRLGDLKCNNRISKEGLLVCPQSYYESILDNGKWDNVWIVTEEGGHRMVQNLKKKYNATVVSDSVLDDFILINSANYIVLSISTLAWWAAWLSNAKEIYFPLLGWWHHQTKRKDIDIRVNENRYIYCDVCDGFKRYRYEDL